MRGIMARLTARVVVSESARAKPRCSNLGGDYDVLVERHRDRPLRARGADAVGAARGVLRRSARTAQRSLGVARRVARPRPRRGAVGRVDGPADEGAPQAQGRTDVEWLGGISDRRARAAHARARRCSARRRCTASRSAWCCSRRWRPARRSSRPRSRGTRTWPARSRRRCSWSRATSRRCATRCAASSTTPPCVSGSSRPGPRACRRVLDGAARRALPRDLRESARRRASVSGARDRPSSTTLALDIAAQVRAAVAPSLGDPGAARTGRGRARRRRHDGDRRDRRGSGGAAASPPPATSRTTRRTAGYVRVRPTPRDLRHRPDRRHPPAAAGLESCCVSIAVVPPERRRARSATSRSVSYTRSRAATCSTRHAVRVPMRAARRSGDTAALLRATSISRALFWTAGLRGRPVMPCRSCSSA